MTHSVVTGSLASAVAAAGTFTASYPSGKDEGSFYAAKGHKLTLGVSELAGGTVLSYPKDFDVTLGTASITITNKTSSSWPVNSYYRLQLEEQGDRQYRADPSFSNSQKNMVASTSVGKVLQINFCPDVADADGYCVSQDLTSAGVFSSSVTAAAAIAAAALAGTADTPRNVVAAWTGAAVLTVTGTDVYGNTLVEKSGSGTSFTGKKAFKTVTGISVSANVTSLTVGTGNVLGLPVALLEQGHVRGVLINGQNVPMSYDIPFLIPATELSAGTSRYVVAPYAGFIDRATVAVDVAIVTGGDVTFEQSNVAVTGLTCTVANSATVGTVVSDQPTTLTGNDATAQITANNLAIEVVPAAAFNGGGALSGVIQVKGGGIFQTAGMVAGGQAATSADTRGTFRPPLDPDGDIVFQVILSTPEPGYIGEAQYTG